MVRKHTVIHKDLVIQKGKEPCKALQRSGLYPQNSLFLPGATVLCFQLGNFHILLSWGAPSIPVQKVSCPVKHPWNWVSIFVDLVVLIVIYLKLKPQSERQIACHPCYGLTPITPASFSECSWNWEMSQLLSHHLNKRKASIKREDWREKLHLFQRCLKDWVFLNSRSCRHVLGHRLV